MGQCTARTAKMLLVSVAEETPSEFRKIAMDTTSKNAFRDSPKVDALGKTIEVT